MPQNEDSLHFPCNRCGLCCELLIRLPEYRDLDDGTGKCRYYDNQHKLCQIYDHRPVKCNVEASYELFQDTLTWEEYLNLNLEGCRNLKESV